MEQLNRWRISVIPGFGYRDFQILVLRDGEDGSVELLGTPEIIKIPESDKYSTRPPSNVGFHLQGENLQQLANQLWDLGFRPLQGEGSVGQLGAVQKHLESSEKLNDRLLQMIESKWSER